MPENTEPVGWVVVSAVLSVIEKLVVRLWLAFNWLRAFAPSLSFEALGNARERIGNLDQCFVLWSIEH